MSTKHPPACLKPFTVAINAGGQSRRMGRDKALVELNGRPMLEQVIERVSGLGQAQTLLVSNDHAAHARFGLPMVRDSLPDGGITGRHLHGADAQSAQPHPGRGLRHAQPQSGAAALHAGVARRRRFRRHRAAGGRLSPGSARGLQPGLHRAGPRANQGRATEGHRLLRPGARALSSMRTEWRPLDPTGRALSNINTPEELAAARERKQVVR